MKENLIPHWRRPAVPISSEALNNLLLLGWTYRIIAKEDIDTLALHGHLYRIWRGSSGSQPIQLVPPTERRRT